tara:strand:- start:36443 stop:37711 length:1269 start_codon:yes stop_codon:yes gene_type:complete
MSKIRLGLVGCGGMGHRHLYGLAELYKVGLCRFEPSVVCDPRRENAESLAQKIKEIFGTQPVIVGNISEIKDQDLQAIDICTDPRHHHTICVEAASKGWDIMTEKPMGLTVRACQIMRQASDEAGCILSVAENYRRDPINRMGKALLDAGIIGSPRYMIHNTAGGEDKMMITVWRHLKNVSGLLLDVGVHFADIMEYYMGPVSDIYAQTRLHEKIRYNEMAGRDPDSSPRHSPGGVYEHWQAEMPAEFEATAEDAAYATLTFESGAVCQYVEEHATFGQGFWHRGIYGSVGSMELPGDRSGQPVTIVRDGNTLQGEQLLELIPNFALDEATSVLFGGERLWRYDFPFPETDRKLIAIEYYDFAEAIDKNCQPEVDGYMGMRSVAVSYGIMESGQAGRQVSMESMMANDINNYQQEINESLGI